MMSEPQNRGAPEQLNREARIGDVLDTVGDGVDDSMYADTVGDGRADTVVPLTLPLQAEAARLTASPAVGVLSVLATLGMLVTFLYSGAEGSFSTPRGIEDALSLFLFVELFARWWATGLRPDFLVRPLVLIDELTLLPTAADLLSPSGKLTGPLLVLRAARILRLLRFFEPYEFEQFVAIFAADGGGGARRPAAAAKAATRREVWRLGARFVFAVASIVVVVAGVEWQCERASNLAFATYSDALYFSVTTLTTVGFGDVVPVTPAGRLSVAVEMLSAATVIPLSLGAFSTALQEDAAANFAAERRDVECPRCALVGHEADARFCRRCGERLLNEVGAARENIPES